MPMAARVYWRGWSESRLASFQGDQGSSNHCAKFASSSCLNLLYGLNLEGGRLASWVEGRSLRGTGRFTIWGNHNGSLVYQTANLVRALARTAGLSPRVESSRMDAKTLVSQLRDRRSLALVSLTYLEGKEPLIARGGSTVSSLGPARLVGGHIMIPAAFDPGHRDQGGRSTPWGFLSSWGAGDQLYWMCAGEFRRTWGRLSLFNTVTVSISPSISSLSWMMGASS